MASSAQMQAARDAADYDNDRKDGRYSAGGDRAHWYTEEREELEPAKRAALDAAMAVHARAFGHLAMYRA